MSAYPRIAAAIALPAASMLMAYQASGVKMDTKPAEVARLSNEQHSVNAAAESRGVLRVFDVFTPLGQQFQSGWYVP